MSASFWIVPVLQPVFYVDNLGRPSDVHRGHRRAMSTSETQRCPDERSVSPMDVDISEQAVIDVPVVPPRPLADARYHSRGRSCSESPPPSRPPAERAPPIFFYHRHEPYFEFTNFARYPVDWDGHSYPTAEHLFQAQKFVTTRPDVVAYIRRLPSPRAALEEAGRLRTLGWQRTDWFDVNVGIMDAILDAKFSQHPRLREMLLRTGECELVEDSPVDSFWGCGHDGQGRNELGKALMRLREKLRHGPP